MADPLSISAALLAVAHFVGEHAVGHIIGGEAHELYRTFIESWREAAGKQPRNQDLEEASLEALRAAAQVLVFEVAGRIEPKKPWIGKWDLEAPAVSLFSWDPSPGIQGSRERWLEALRLAIGGETFNELHGSLQFNEENLHQCFNTGEVCQALGPGLADQFLKWSRAQLQSQEGCAEPPEFAELLAQGWSVTSDAAVKRSAPKLPPGAVELQRITLAQVYCLFFREHLKTNARVFRIFVADTLSELRRSLDAQGPGITRELTALREALAARPTVSSSLDVVGFEAWLNPCLGEINNVLGPAKGLLDSLVRSQGELLKQHGQILGTLTVLRTELARGNVQAQPPLAKLNDYLQHLEHKLDYLLAGLPIHPFRLPDPPTYELELLQAKHRAVDLAGRDTDLGALFAWVESPEPISARLLVGGAGTGKTRLALELLLRVNAELPHWQAGLVLGRELRKFDATKQAADWTWPAPTLLVVDYAQTLTGSLAELLRALTYKNSAAHLHPLRLLLLERQPGDWFDALLREGDSNAPCTVGTLFHPPAPVSLTRLPEGALRRQILEQTLAKAAKLAGQPPLQLPPPGQLEFEASLKRDIFDQPLNLMLAALAAGEFGLQSALTRSRIELAEVLASRELARVERFARDPAKDAQKRALRHLAACATMERGFTVPELAQAADEELAALKLNWPDGPGDLATVLKLALPGERWPVAPVEPDFVGEALVLAALAQPDAKNGPDRWRSWEAAVSRCFRRDPRATPATLLHAFQNFGQLAKYDEPLLAATDALIRAGLAEADPSLLTGLESALPHQTVELRQRAFNITHQLYSRLKSLLDQGHEQHQAEVARLANNLAVRLSELGRRADALLPAQEAVDLRRALARQNPDAFTPNLASSLNNLANRLSDLGRRTDALLPAQEAVDLRRTLARQNPDAFTPDLASSLGMFGQVLEANERREEALASFAEGIRVLTGQFQSIPAAFAPVMGQLVREYLRLAETMNQAPDEALLAPVFEVFERMQAEAG